MDNGTDDLFVVPLSTPAFLQCCPWWLLDTPAVREVAGYAVDAGNGNLPAFFAGGTVPVALRDAIRAYDSGYQKGLTERFERERQDKRSNH